MIDSNILSPVINALGWTLTHFVWQGLLLGAIYAALVSGLKRASSVTRYWIGMGTLAAMLLVTVITFVIVYEAPQVTTAVVMAVATPVQTVLTEASRWESILMQMEIFMPWAVLAWLSGVILLSGRIAVDFWRIRKLAMVGVKPLPEPWPGIVQRLCFDMGMTRLVRVMESARVSVPMVIGWLKPVVLIPPSALMGLSQKQLELIISHELAHIKRYDYLFNLMQLVVETLLFYHPVVRRIAIQVRLERENCCDDIVVEQTTDTLAYARALTEVEGMRCSTGMQVALAATGGHLVGRVRRLAGMPTQQRGSMHWIAGLVVVVAGVVLVSGGRYVADRFAPEDVLDRPEPIAPVSDATVEPDKVFPAAESAAEAVRVSMIRQLELATPFPIEESVAAEIDVEEPAPVVQEKREPVVRESQASQSIAVQESAPVPAVIVVEQPEPVDELPAVADQEPEVTSATQDVVPQEVSVVEAEAAAEPGTTLSGGQLTESVSPRYPRQARLRGIEGFVKVSYSVDEKGRVEDVKVLDAVPAKVFDATVRKALAKWRYEPFLNDGAPVSQTVKQVFEFNVERGELALAEKPARCRRSTGTRLCRGSMDPGIIGVKVAFNTF